MRLYVAGASAELSRVKYIMNAVKLKRHQISHDWTVLVEQNLKKRITNEKRLNAGANRDFLGVCTCDALIFVTPLEKSTGAWVELGIALALCKPIHVVGTNLDSCFFFRSTADFTFYHDTTDFTERFLGIPS